MRHHDDRPVSSAARAAFASRTLCHARGVRSLARHRHVDGIQACAIEPADSLVLPRARTSVVIWSAPAEQSGDGALDSDSRDKKSNKAVSLPMSSGLPPALQLRLAFSAMNLKRALFAAVGFSLLFFLSCKPKQARNRLDENHFPRIVLWAWERPENLKAVDANRFAVAFLAQTLILKGDDVVFSPRHQPLDVSPVTKLMAVTRIESQKQTGQPVALSASQKQKLISLILRTRELRNVSAIQIDFDAAASQREFYRALLRDLRAKLPDNVPLIITALASFCVGKFGAQIT